MFEFPLSSKFKYCCFSLRFCLVFILLDVCCPINMSHPLPQAWYLGSYDMLEFEVISYFTLQYGTQPNPTQPKGLMGHTWSKSFHFELRIVELHDIPQCLSCLSYINLVFWGWIKEWVWTFSHSVWGTQFVHAFELNFGFRVFLVSVKCIALTTHAISMILFCHFCCNSNGVAGELLSTYTSNLMSKGKNQTDFLEIQRCWQNQLI